MYIFFPENHPSYVMYEKWQQFGRHSEYGRFCFDQIKTAKTYWINSYSLEHHSRNPEISIGIFLFIVLPLHFVYCLLPIVQFGVYLCMCAVKNKILGQLSCGISSRKSNTHVNYPVTNWHYAVVTDIDHFQTFSSFIFIFPIYSFHFLFFTSIFCLSLSYLA